jgi:hypothetical protein
MGMPMWLTGGYTVVMGVLMVFVVKVFMAMLDGLMHMKMLVMFRQVQVNPEPHGQTRKEQTRCDGLTKKGYGQCRSEKRRY